jgi:hypothetical protein
VELNLGAWLEERGAELDARVDHIVVTHGVPVESDRRIGVVVIVRTTEHLHHNLMRAKRESLEDDLANQRLPANKDAQTLMVELKLGVESEIALLAALRCILK